MPIQGPASYLPVTGEFLDHWAEVNTALGGAGPLVIRKETIGAAADVAVAGLQSLYDELVLQHQTVQAGVVALDLARGELDDQKTAVLAMLNMFNEKVRALLATTKWERALSDVPSITAGEGTFMRALNGALALWQEINAKSALGVGVPLVLRDGTNYDLFETTVNDLPLAWRTEGKADRKLKLEREERNDLQDRIYPMLKQYRVVVPGFFAADAALMATLPRLTPEKGRTPEPVNASVVWDAAAGKAKITWEASDDADLEKYQVRYSPGTEYHQDEEDVLATFTPEEAREYLTDHALTQPGATALFRVYVVLTTANEKATSTLSVTRP
jgi:hypothetical protein